ncbi:MAG TPA: hypothetical protein PKZ37_16580 [Gallionellaceae bacterium]|nr:hypothetical protein [Gallionellaceae bacterium]
MAQSFQQESAAPSEVTMLAHVIPGFGDCNISGVVVLLNQRIPYMTANKNATAATKPATNLSKPITLPSKTHLRLARHAT